MKTANYSKFNNVKDELARRKERQFCKQSCTKIQQGLEDMPSNCGSRAIWELLQNARDLAKEINGKKEAVIKMTLTANEFIFAHQGKAFDYDSLGSLVKQVSSQSKEDADSVGQYGTGFITTHAFGRRILVNGSLDVKEFFEGQYINIDGFAIDRTFENIGEFVEKMANQLHGIDELVVSEKFGPEREWTELRYQLNSAHNAYDKALEALKNAEKLLPLVMTFNNRIKEVAIINEVTNEKIIFTNNGVKNLDDVNVMSIRIETAEDVRNNDIYFLSSEDGQDIVVLPLKDLHTAESLRNFPKLFVFFPLLGTEDFGMDAIFHSSRFFPVEKRNGIHLPQENENVRSKFEANVQVLEDLRDMVFDYYQNHYEDINGWENILDISFECESNSEDETNDFFKSYKKSWTSFYETLPVFKIDGELRSLNCGKVSLFDDELNELIKDEETNWLEKIYSVLYTMWWLPEKDMVVKWSEVVSSWDSELNCKVTIEESAELIKENLEDGQISIEQVYDFDYFLSQTGNADLFDEYELIPNREGILDKKSERQDASTIIPELYEISRALIPETCSKFINNKFADLAKFSSYSRNELRGAINEELSDIKSDSYGKKKSPERCDDNTLNTLIALSSIQYSADSKNLRKEVLPTICDYYDVDYNEIILKKLDSNENDLSTRPFEHLVENVLLEISQQDEEWVRDNSGYLLRLLSELSSWSEFYNKNNGDGMIRRYGIFPNLSGFLCMAEDLKSGDVDERLKSLYNDVLDYDLNDDLVNPDYENFYDFEKVDAFEIANEIELSLEESDFKSQYVLDIIDYMDKSDIWTKWFSKIAGQKADLFMRQVKPECKDSIYKLMKIEDPDKLSQLAEIAGATDMDMILNLAQQELVRITNEKADFDFKAQLGTFVEDKIQKRLSEELEDLIPENLRIENCQNGQDLIVSYNDKPVYFIEVKSRWVSNSSVNMSRTQMFRSVKESGRYALCYVDMSGNRINTSGIHEYPEFNLIKDQVLFVDNIGELNKECIESVSDCEDKIHIGGDYKCIVPQKVIKENGVLIDTFVEKMVYKISEQIG